MALQAAYVQFLAAPNPAALADKASLNYITTTTTFSGPAEIIKHLSTLRNHAKKTKEVLLSAVEGRDSLALAAEVDTTLEFGMSGGPYLPGLDDNFLADRTVHLAVTHFVAFDSAGKIVQIRQSWDQGSLLKQLDVIGRSGRNWPIRDSTDQIKLIARCVKGEASTSGGDLPSRSRGSSTNAMRDPHTSLDLFAPRVEQEIDPASVVSPYAGKTRPRQRSFTEILGDQEGDGPGSPERPGSPSKGFVAPKAGAGKNFPQPRLFEGHDLDEPPSPEIRKSPERVYRPNPKKYDHFDFVDGSDPKDAPAPGTEFDKVDRGKHSSQWDFKDFVTPSKPRGRPARSQDVRHWSTENDEAVAETPAAQRPAPPKPRRDAEKHFELQDDGFPSNEPRAVPRPRGAGHNEGLGLYKNNVHSQDGGAPPEDPNPNALGNITNLKDRRRDFEAHYVITDKSPGPAAGAPAEKPKAVTEDRKKAVKMMESNWSAFDQSPASHKENQPTRAVKKGDDRGISIGGDGMGGKKGSARNYLFGDVDEEEEAPRPAPRKPGNAQQTSAKGGSFWDF